MPNNNNLFTLTHAYEIVITVFGVEYMQIMWNTDTVKKTKKEINSLFQFPFYVPPWLVHYIYL